MRLVEQACTIYDVMAKEAIDGLWEGAITSIFDNEEGLSRSNYSAVMRAMQRMNSIKQLQRGGGTSPSVYAVLQRPSIELYHENKDRVGGLSTREGANGKKIKDLTDRVNDMEVEVARMQQLVNRLQGSLQAAMAE